MLVWDWGKRCIIVGNGIDNCLFADHPEIERYESVKQFIAAMSQETPER